MRDPALVVGVGDAPVGCGDPREFLRGSQVAGALHLAVGGDDGGCVPGLVAVDVLDPNCSKPSSASRPAAATCNAMAFYRQAGIIPRKRHTQFRRSAGSLYYEELMGEEGFSSDSALLYHEQIPSAIVDARPWALPDHSTAPNEPLLPRHLRLHDLFDSQEWKRHDVVTARRLVLGNADVRNCYVVAGEASPLYRNAVGDECVYVESGSATVQTVFGPLEVATGDYVVLPRSTTHRWVPGPDEPFRAYCLEANSHIAPPPRYLSRFGQFQEHAPYCERDLRGPGAPEVGEGTDVEVLIKHRGADPGMGGLAGTVYIYPRHTFDVVGWDGCLYPYAVNIADFEPITGRIHQPPPAHQVFAGTGFVICNFVPRKVSLGMELRRDLPPRPATVTGELAALARWLPRPGRHRGGLRNADHPAELPAARPRGHRHLRSLDRTGLRGRNRVRRRHAIGPGSTGPAHRLRQPRVRGVPGQRLVRP